MEDINYKTPIGDVLQAYIERGFGSMNKNDFEVWIFSQLLDGELKGKSNYDISTLLRMPESKVKRLAYEAHLKYPKNRDYKQMLSDILKYSQFDKEGKHIVFVIEDVTLRKWLDSELKKNHEFSDTSFNSEIVRLNASGYSALLNCIDSDLADKLKNRSERKDLIEVISAVFIAAAKQVAGKTGEKVAERVVNMAFDKLEDYLEQK